MSCICWNVSFRIHEILSKKRNKFDPPFTLVGKDVKLKQILQNTECYTDFNTGPLPARRRKKIALSIKSCLHYEAIPTV